MTDQQRAAGIEQESARHAGDCLVCGTAIDRRALDEWCSAAAPFCWKCGSYYRQEGNHLGLCAEDARRKAGAFDEKVETMLTPEWKQCLLKS